MFARLEIETKATCNRSCPTCLRNSSIKDTSSWFTNKVLPLNDILRIVDESLEIGFAGDICLQHYNEPLMDDRLVEIATLIKPKIPLITFCSNGDFLTEQLAKDLDGLIDSIHFSLYMEEPVKSKRTEWIKSLFNKTYITINPGQHIVTHFNKSAIAKPHVPCFLPEERLIINHKGQMLLCCEDLTGNFELGDIYSNSIKELWYSDKHQDLMYKLQTNRVHNDYCDICPR